MPATYSVTNAWFRAPSKNCSFRRDWSKGAATSLQDFEDPLATDDYALCIFEAGKPRPLLAAHVPAGGTCPNNVPCWAFKTILYKYKDKAATPDGITKMLLKSSTTAGKPKIGVKGQGTLLRLPTPPLLGTVRVELRTSAPGSVCWGADHTTVLKNSASSFTAKGD